MKAYFSIPSNDYCLNFADILPHSDTESHTAQTHGTAIADILINTMNTKHSFKFPVRDKGCVQQDAAVIELFILCKKKAQ